MAADFLCISPSAGDAINATAARQLRKTNPLVFTMLLLLSVYPSHKALSPKMFEGSHANTPQAWISGW
ncbi:MAG: hypothetical protein DME67_01020 [Verrucomicrobia bacterium]|nr:MAG: hypothetical protein DME67_01020 [Verrucomicrobiota bacterium]